MKIKSLKEMLRFELNGNFGKLMKNTKWNFQYRISKAHLVVKIHKLDLKEDN